MDLPPDHKIPVGGKVVGKLGGQTADVDGIGAGQPVGKCRPLTGGKDILHPGLGIVKITPDGADGDIACLLGDHLGPLDLGDAAVGIEHADPDPGHIPEAFQRRLAGVAGGGGEDENVLPDAFDFFSGGEHLGEHAQRHILKGGGGAPEQLQHGKIAHGHRGGQVVGLEFTHIGPPGQGVHIGDSGKQGSKQGRGHGNGILLQAGPPVESGKGLRQVQAAVGGDAGQHGPGAVHSGGRSPGRTVQHSFLLILHKNKADPQGILCFLWELHFG